MPQIMGDSRAIETRETAVVRSTELLRRYVLTLLPRARPLLWSFKAWCLELHLHRKEQGRLMRVSGGNQKVLGYCQWAQSVW
jgi:hypothetical protein